MPATQITGHTPGQGFPPKPTFPTVDVTNGQTTSAAGVDLNGWTLVGVTLDAGLDGTTLAWMSSADDSTYVTMLDFTGTAISLTVAASRYIPIDPSLYVGVRYIKPVVASQTGTTTITLHVRPIA